MRVLFDARPGEVSQTGIGRYARSLARVLASGLGKHEVISLGGKSSLKLHASTPLEEELALPQLLESEHVDLYHSPFFHLPALLPCKSVVTIHDAIPAVRPELTTPGFARLFEEAVEAAARADAVVCPSESAKQDLVHSVGVMPEKIHVIPEAPDAVFKPATVEERARVRRVHGLGSGSERFLLCVGSLETRKNPACVLEALASLKNEAPLVLFVGPDAGFDVEAEAKRRAVKARRMGAVSDADLVALLSESFALVFASHYEGFGLPIVEAFACETAVLASNASAIPEVTGEAARLFDPADPATLAAHVRELVTAPELRRELVHKGRERLALFTPDRVRAGFLNLYTNLERVLEESSA